MKASADSAAAAEAAEQREAKAVARLAAVSCANALCIMSEVSHSNVMYIRHR